MEQFINKKVKYIGSNDNKVGLINGHVYDVSHTYATNVCVIIGKTPTGTKIASVNVNKFEIVGTMDAPFNVHSVLLFNNQPIGVRFKDVDNFYDVEAESLKGVTQNHLIGYKTQTLKTHGDLLVTDEELTNNISSKDMSQNSTFCKVAIRILIGSKY